MAYSASEARQQLLDTLAEATDELGFALACLAEAYDNLNAQNADGLREQLFRPVQVAYGHAQLPSPSSLAAKGYWVARSSTAPRTGATAFTHRAAEAISEADRALTALQDSMLPVEVGDSALRSGLVAVRDRVRAFPNRGEHHRGEEAGAEQGDARKPGRRLRRARVSQVHAGT
jgi:hypothetical protein